MQNVESLRDEYKEVINEHIDIFLQKYEKYVGIDEKLKKQANEEKDLVGAYLKAEEILPQIIELEKNAEKELKRVERVRNSWSEHPNKFVKIGEKIVADEQIQKNIALYVKEYWFWYAMCNQLGHCISILKVIEEKYKKMFESASRQVEEGARTGNIVMNPQNDGR